MKDCPNAFARYRNRPYQVLRWISAPQADLGASARDDVLESGRWCCVCVNVPGEDSAG